MKTRGVVHDGIYGFSHIAWLGYYLNQAQI
ncbi:hypothetical protein SAMN04488121_101514 [Chitinophaga filiformis]|uniref:Uncharacterized protein n=1 Tax=Chitinophaga filiformis TaxID=104663 RepID=A0A1G7HLD6_CHIFI|nr:hypothetical protein SAMN04488121_101514 [Chitinophaga filiformis]